MREITGFASICGIVCALVIQIMLLRLHNKQYACQRQIDDLQNEQIRRLEDKVARLETAAISHA